MKRLVLSSLLVVGFAGCAAVNKTTTATTVRQIAWKDLAAAGRLAGGEVQPSGELKVENTEAERRTVRVLVLDNPGITAYRYAFEGNVRCEDVADASYLEMWNVFPGGGEFFTRTLDETGPMGKLSGTSPARPFVLPFTSNATAGTPRQLIVNVVFTGRGTVYLSPMRLVQAHSAHAWWDDRTGGLVGVLGGSLLGILGAAVGMLGGLGKARRLTLGLLFAGVILGVASLLAGIVAAATGQPYAVHYPLLLGGLIGAAVFGGLLPVLRQRYQQAELRKMAALDLGRGP